MNTPVKYVINCGADFNVYALDALDANARTVLPCRLVGNGDG